MEMRKLRKREDRSRGRNRGKKGLKDEVEGLGVYGDKLRIYCRNGKGKGRIQREVK